MQAARGATLTKAGRLRALVFGVWLFALALDVSTKILVVERLEHREPIRLLGGAVNLVVSRNSGAAFSFAQGATLLFTAIAVGVIVVIIRSLSRLGSTGWAITLGLLAGGAMGNLVDRLARAPGVGRGAVVDFISVPHFASFNIADSAITVGALFAVLLSLRGIELDGTRRGARQAE